MPFRKGIRPKVNIIVQQEFELTYYGVAVQHVSYYTTEILLSRTNIEKISWTKWKYIVVSEGKIIRQPSQLGIRDISIKIRMCPFPSIKGVYASAENAVNIF